MSVLMEGRYWKSFGDGMKYVVEILSAKESAVLFSPEIRPEYNNVIFVPFIVTQKWLSRIEAIEKGI